MTVDSRFAILNVNKPGGMTSRDVVNRIQGLVPKVRVGHAGTLDPMATGVLVVCLGKATRLVESIQRLPKRYLARFRLGYSSDTEDVEGQVVPVAVNGPLDREMLEGLLPRFTGKIQQVPPAFSAIKVAGVRAYTKARRGESVILPAREVEIHSLRLVRFEFPEFSLEITCGSGTYVRSLGRDMARLLGTEAIMSALVRTAVGPYGIESSSPFNALTGASLDSFLLPPRSCLQDSPQIQLTAEEVRLVLNGQSLRRRVADEEQETIGLDENGELVAILANRSGRWAPVRVFGHD